MNIFKNIFKKTSSSTWYIVNKKHLEKEVFTNFLQFETKCKQLINNGEADDHYLEYWKGDIMEERCKLNVYFGKKGDWFVKN